MARYLPLFSITAKHAFFTDGICRTLEFLPSPEAAEWLDRAGLLAKAFSDGIGIYYPEDRLDVLRHHLGGVANELMLEFKAFAKDTYFCQYTFPNVNIGNKILRFDGRQAVEDAQGMRLHTEQYVSDACLQETEGGSPPAPVLTADIPLTEADCAINSEKGEVASKQYYLAFEPRKTFWKYYFLGDVARKNAYIADLNGSVEFERIDAPELQGRDALVFISRAPIPMQDVPPQRFQLRSRESVGLGEKILIKRLPNASSNRIGKRKLDGKEVLVSEIYVNQ
jgi:hypothetical protein